MALPVVVVLPHAIPQLLLPATPALLDHPAQLDHQDPLVRLGPMANPDQLAAPPLTVLLAPRDFLDLLVNQALTASTALMAPQL